MPRRKSNQYDKKQGQQWELPADSHVWVYLRHSPGDAQTIDSQQSGMRQWCAQLGLIIDHEFIDEGVEGSKEERVQFQQMMALSRQSPRPVNGIAVWSFSRFARSQLDSQYYKAELRKRGYVVVSKIDDVPNNEIAPIIESVIDWKNQRFLDDLSADVKRGMVYVVERGFAAGGPAPIGYRVERVEMGRRRNGEIRYGKRYVKDEAVADRVALAWQMKLRDDISYGQVHEATRLFADKHGYTFFYDNWLYAGIYVYDGKRYPIDWEQGARFCEPYVTVDEFYQVQRNRQRRTISAVAPRSLSSRYLLTGLLHCAHCASQGVPSTIAGSPYSGGRDSFYRCLSRYNGRSADCTTPCIACWKIDDVVLATLREMVLTPDFVQGEVEQANAKLLSRNTDVRLQVTQAERLAKEQEKRVESLVTLIEKKGLTAILERQYDEANRAWLDATTRLAGLRSQSVQSQVKLIVMADVLRYLDGVISELDTGTLQQKQRLVKQFVERVDVYNDRLHVKLRFRLDAVVTLPSFEAVASNDAYGMNLPATRCAARHVHRRYPPPR